MHSGSNTNYPSSYNKGKLFVCERLSQISSLGMTHERCHVFFLYFGSIEHMPLVPLAFELDMGHRTWVKVYVVWNFLVKFVCVIEGEQTPNCPLQILDRFFFSMLVVSCGFFLIRDGSSKYR